ncbi:MAG: F0F1 ATP synthase subunit gamma [Clostridia bacterium]|nr:F0F1 ATP synthase subunit gamma [Clostridia bacterium]
MNTRDLKRRILTVQDTVKITRAMQMISASKLYKARQKSDSGYRYMKGLREVFAHVDEKLIDRSPLLAGNGSERVAVIVIAGDKGLCGDCNHRVLSLADEVIESKNVSKIYTIGQEAREYYLRKHLPINNFYVHIANEPHSFDAIMVANDMLDFYMKGEYGEIYLIYTSTPTYTRMVPVVKKLLPFERPQSGDRDLTFEPHTAESAKNFLCQYLMSIVYSALADSALAVNYKRMLSMQESTKNGEQLIGEVTQEYNHQRQESITNELVTASSSNSMGNQL